MGRKPCRHSINSHIQTAMKLNLSTLAFGSIIEKGGGTPSWGTELGQGEGYKFSFENLSDFFTGMVYKAVKDIEAGFKLALTGTPIENRLSELWSIFDYLMPGFLYPYTRFKEQLEIPITQNKDETATLRLQKMVQPFVLRRLKN